MAQQRNLSVMMRELRGDDWGTSRRELTALWQANGPYSFKFGAGSRRAITNTVWVGPDQERISLAKFYELSLKKTLTRPSEPLVYVNTNDEGLGFPQPVDWEEVIRDRELHLLPPETVEWTNQALGGRHPYIFRREPDLCKMPPIMPPKMPPF